MHTREQYSIIKRMKCRLMFQRVSLNHILKQQARHKITHCTIILLRINIYDMEIQRQKTDFVAQALGKETVGTGYY